MGTMTNFERNTWILMTGLSVVLAIAHIAFQLHWPLWWSLLPVLFVFITSVFTYGLVFIMALLFSMGGKRSAR